MVSVRPLGASDREQRLRLWRGHPLRIYRAFAEEIVAADDR